MAEIDSLVWGEDYYDSSHAQSPGCVNSDCSRTGVMLFEINNMRPIAQGVRKVPKLTKGRTEYALMCECPECGEHYWFHINRLTAVELKQSKREENS